VTEKRGDSLLFGRKTRSMPFQWRLAANDACCCRLASAWPPSAISIGTGPMIKPLKS
jgi:hypothetical protein